LSHSGSGRSGGQQPVGAWGYESYTPGLTWVEQEAELSPYVGSQIKIRFRVAADGAEQRDGFYVDDIRVYGYTVGTVPAIPTLASPASGAVSQPVTLNLYWNVAAGAQTYRLQVSTDSLFGTTVIDDPSLTDTTRQITGLSLNTAYYWRVRAQNVAGSS
jgi:hypothetical protein